MFCKPGKPLEEFHLKGLQKTDGKELVAQNQQGAKKNHKPQRDCVKFFIERVLSGNFLQQKKEQGGYYERQCKGSDTKKFADTGFIVQMANTNKRSEKAAIKTGK